MKPYGIRPKSKRKCQGHGDCQVCLEKKPPSKKRARAQSRLALKRKGKEEDA